jgi:hypothetical protein
LNSGHCICKVGALLLQLLLQSVIALVILNIGSLELFTWTDLQLQFSRSQPPQLAKITGVSYHTWYTYLFFAVLGFEFRALHLLGSHSTT